MNLDKTDITVLLDRSGSMETIASDVTGGLNAFLAEQRALPGEASLTLVQFDANHGGLCYEVLRAAEPVRAAAPLREGEFRPRGSTPLHDAMGRAIDETGARLAALPEAERPGKVLFVAITDGLENASQRETAASVAARVRLQTDVYQWQFVYIGANQDAVLTGGEMGIARSAARDYVADAAGTMDMMEALSGATANFRKSRRRPEAFWAEKETEAEPEARTPPEAPDAPPAP